MRADNRSVVTKNDWAIEPMPEKTATFTINQRFTDEEMENLKRGHMPGEMEDRWFAYFEDNKLYIHRSWSGICIYIVEFNAKPHFLAKFLPNKLKVIVNRDNDQYACDDIQEDKDQLEELLRWFS